MNSGRPETMENLPALYTIFQGEVAMVTDYGAFIKIPGCRKQGLVHRTHMSSCRVDKPSEIVDVGDKVWVKLIGREMKNDRIKVSLSMKVVNQGTGKDLDPNNVIIEQEERRRRSFQDYTGQKITLEAVLNTTCKKCGCKGHFAKDCFMQPGGTKYSLIPEEEEEEKEEAKEEGIEKPDPTKNSSRKRKKEKKKKKHRDKKSSDCDSSDSESDMGKKARHASKDSKATKKKKKKKKHKKHKE
ncbi:nucleolar protein of 40 kDa isoform X1 [Cricetulus griseus]|uniref:Zinc finger CCHC domain-containing protein 17 n=4 Tax=Cricetulus griseus TaxID=10029 RepID=A0A8C2MB07_CRIGR|nr:nucleolar protein of 40 kDa isoform X1 [Cricetulus griseus]XP_007624736.1 nucleolar protein of 40 kDa isoform X1 [Cricetulus griseus]XP_007624743.1 nucleolar protein of 40 kDa isoform X1 [Cricetulus griseus]XP_027255230.1 nucleolar protein of 40 kDa isoform X1 [Cricetulus griseus]XP_027255231.1 nucleolar protein of 40 kDa isoform X1 [Cricetulus griseus]XP_027255232.1 nucleolar protein of 40 kDa isoform X1 [Cricetulus griseus]ERE85394.1 nucleolar protein [Cricetulus griseus]